MLGQLSPAEFRECHVGCGGSDRRGSVPWRDGSTGGRGGQPRLPRTETPESLSSVHHARWLQRGHMFPCIVVFQFSKGQCWVLVLTLMGFLMVTHFPFSLSLFQGSHEPGLLKRSEWPGPRVGYHHSARSESPRHSRSNEVLLSSGDVYSLVGERTFQCRLVTGWPGLAWIWFLQGVPPLLNLSQTSSTHSENHL